MAFLVPYIKKYWKWFSLAVSFLMVEALCDLLQPTIMSKIVDVGVAQRNLQEVFKLGGLMLLITAVGAVSASIRNVVSSRVSQNFGADLRSGLFRKIQSLTFQNIDQMNRASLVTRLTNDITQVQVFVNGLMRIFVKAPLLAIGGLVMATRLNPHLSVIFAVVIPVIGMLILLNMRISFPFFNRVQKAIDGVNGVMREYLFGVRVVKAFNRFDFEVRKFDRASSELQSAMVAAGRVMATFNPTLQLSLNLGIVAVLWLGGIRVGQGQMQIGHVIAFINYMTQILFSLMMVSMVFNMFVRARASAVRIGEVFAADSTVAWEDRTVQPAAEAGRIDFENVSFSYKGAAGEPVLKNATFTCKPGETFAIIGSTGAGKSTLVNLIPRFYEAISGTIKVNGVDIRHQSPARLREKIAVVPQKTTLFTGTVGENIRWGNETATREQIEQAARIAQAHEFIAAAPEGYETRIGRGGVNFSGGQKQRLSIARALVRQPEILILDDSTSAVDVATEARIKEGLKKYARGLTCLLIAQRITSVMDADQILVLDQGEVEGLGKHADLLKTCKVYQEIYRSQVGKEVQASV